MTNGREFGNIVFWATFQCMERLKWAEGGREILCTDTRRVGF